MPDTHQVKDPGVMQLASLSYLSTQVSLEGQEVEVARSGLQVKPWSSGVALL